MLLCQFRAESTLDKCLDYLHNAPFKFSLCVFFQSSKVYMYIFFLRACAVSLCVHSLPNSTGLFITFSALGNTFFYCTLHSVVNSRLNWLSLSLCRRTEVSMQLLILHSLYDFLREKNYILFSNRRKIYWPLCQTCSNMPVFLIF